MTSFTILYVREVRASAQFYADHLGLAVLEESPGFAMLGLGPEAFLGLWKRDGVSPAAGAQIGGTELAISVEGRADVEARHRAWAGAGVTILAEPTALDFGFSVTAADPDGHRLRVFAPA